MTTATQQFLDDSYGQSPNATPFSIASLHLAEAIDANNLLNGGSLTGNLEFLAGDAVSATGSTQATGTQLTGQITNVETVTAGQGVNLIASTPGQFNLMLNTGTADAIAYAAQGNTVDTINTFAGSIGVVVPPGGLGFFASTKAGTIEANGINPQKAGYVANIASASATLAASSLVTGEAVSVIDMTGSLSGGGALTLPTVAQLLAAWPFANLNSGLVLRVINHSAGAFAWTVTSNGSFVTAGSSTVAQGALREFQIKVINGTSVVAQNISV